GAAAFKQRVSQSVNSSQASRELEDIVRFLVAVDNVRLTYFEIVSNGFQQPLFSDEGELTWNDEEKLMGTLIKLGDPQEVSAAVSAFINRAEADKALQPAKPGLSAPKSGIIDSVLSFFGIMDEENDIARQQVLDMYAAINEPYEFEESFLALDENQKAGAANFDEFIDKVRSGEIEDMVSVRHNLMQMGPMEGIMQDLHPDSNRPGGEIIHRVGAEAVKRGAELNVEIIKEVITTTFPGMDQGFDYADKVNEWAEFVHQVYTDPLQAASDELQGQATDAIKDRIKVQFQNLFPDMDEDDVDELVDQVTSQIKDSVTTLVDLPDQVVQEETEGLIDETETEVAQTEVTETESANATSTEESSDNGSGPAGPQEEIVLPEDLAEQQNDEEKGDNSDFAWNAGGNCWDYIGAPFENYTWSCASQCFNYNDQEWSYDCTSDCPVYIGPGADAWAWDCQTNCWQYILPNYTYNCTTKCLEYTGPDAHLWYWDCNRSCVEYIGPAVDGYTWSCEWNRWVADE
ncbi:MAG: hypothetical protein MUO40_10785, partial [Anaerolineaceae bacterium]|nr:hypothetical protein [Anaerolineaceae bacterium]